MKLLYSFLTVLALSACAHQPKSEIQRAPASEMARAFQIEGTHPVHGAYSGELGLRARADGRYHVTRSVQFDSLKFAGKNVSEVWSAVGDLKPESGAETLTVEFALQRAGFLTIVDTFKRTKEDFSSSDKIQYSVSLAPGASAVIKSLAGVYADRLTEARAVPGAPWIDLRKTNPSYGDSYPFIGKIAMSTALLPVTNKYRNDELVKKYHDRPEYKARMQYFVTDATDFDFLRANPNTIRVANKVLDQISMVEATTRAAAYGPTLAQKAGVFEQDMTENHLNELGLFSSAIYDSEGKRIGFGANGDGGLWSGMYAGSQAMRWIATGEAQALENFKKVTRGLMLLMDVTGDPKEFARTAHLAVAGEKITEPWALGAGRHSHIKFIRGGNNDMIKGMFHAFAWAFEILPPGDPFLNEVAAHAAALPKLRIANEKNHIGNILQSRGLAALASKKREDLLAYLKTQTFISTPVNALGLDDGFYYGGIADWSGINLGMVAKTTDVLIARLLQKQFGNGTLQNTQLRRIVAHMRLKLMRNWAIYTTARRDFLTIAADAFGIGGSKWELDSASRPLSFPKKDLWLEDRASAIWSLREIPVPWGNHKLAWDYTWKPDWSMSAWPHLPWKVFQENKPMEFYYQSAYAYPIFEGIAFESDNFWTSSLSISGGGSTRPIHGRTDYLHTYWMGRMSGLIGASD